MEKKFYFKLFLLLPFLSILVDPKIYWAFHVFILLVVITERIGDRRKINKSHLILLLVIPLFWSFLFSLEDSLYYIVQSLFYLTTPLILILIGIKISINVSQKMVFKYIIYFGTIGALYFLGIAFFNFGFNSFTDPFAIRIFFAWVSITSVMSIFLTLYSEKFGIVLILNKKFKWFITGVNVLALYFTASRTYYLIFLIFLLIFLYNTNKKKLFFVIIIFLSCGFFFLSFFSNNKFIQKIESSASEITIKNYQTEEDINAKYRGYETEMAIETYLSGSELNLIFGHGFGKLVDLKTDIELAGTYWRKIPTLHNGYLYLLIREGLMGLIFYFVFFSKLYNLRYYVKEFNFYNILILACIISLLISNYVVGTFFSTEMTVVWIFFGVYIGHVAMVRKKKNTSKQYDVINEK